MSKTGLRNVALMSVALGYSSFAAALGLGDITLQSALEQPFSAEIALVDTGDLGEDDLSVSLATAEEFSRAGVERVFFLNDLRFTPIIRGNRSVIQVHSSKPVSEPFLNFLVQVSRPNGRLLREYTVLLDPPGSAPAGYRLPPRSAPLEPASAVTSAAPPAASQGKRYTVVQGDNPWLIARRLHEAGSPGTVNELARGLQALNPGSERLFVGQNLLLPDVAVVPGPAPASAASPDSAAPAAPAPGVEVEQLARATLDNQQLQKTVEELQAKVQAQDQQLAGNQKQLVELQTQLAEVASAPVVPVTPVATPAPVAAPVAAVTTPVDSGSGPNLLLVLALLLVLVALLAAWLIRRRRQPARVEPAPGAPSAVDEPLVSRVVPGVAAAVVPGARVEPLLETAPRREPAQASDALEGVSIYIAYGRFSEAAGILREAIARQPERTDLRLRLLDVLAQQGDSAAYAEQERALLDMGFSAPTLLDLRAKHPKLQALASEPEAPLPSVTPSAPPATAPVALAAAAVVAPVLAAEWNSPEAPATESAVARPVEDEFQLNLDDLSMDADWDLVSPFDTAPAQRSTPAEPGPERHEPAFSSNLNDLPQVFEMPDEQFLSDFSQEPELQPEASPSELTLSLDDGGLDDDFLDSFALDDAAPLHSEPLEVDFDSLEREQASSSKLEQAQTCIDSGDHEQASQLLHELLREGDEPLKQTARDLLASIR